MKTAELVFESKARTATETSRTFTNQNRAPGALVVIKVTAATDTPSVVFKLQGVDQVSGAAWTILESAAITGTGTTVLRIHPSLTGSANTVAKDVMPAAFNIVRTHGDADSITDSVTVHLVG